MKYKNLNGFTLVELLIVIALIAILSVAVLATINPIEQINKARDAKFKNDTAEVLSAYERYYASQNNYPWMKFTDSADVTVESQVLYRSDQAGFGICYSDPAASLSTATVTTCPSSGTSLGLLIEADELKAAFAGKSEFQDMVASSPHTENGLWTYKDSGSGGSIYVCYIPKAKSNRQQTDKLYCLNKTEAGVITRAKAAATGCVALAVGSVNWGTAGYSTTDAKFRCVPE